MALINRGRGLDIILNTNKDRSNREKHFYRFIDGQLNLIQVHVPIDELVHYLFRKHSNEKFNRLEATYLMPLSLIPSERIKRKN